MRFLVLTTLYILVKTHVSLDIITLKSSLTTKPILGLDEKIFVYPVLNTWVTVTTEKIHIKCDCSDGSSLKGIRKPILLIFLEISLLDLRVFLYQKQKFTKLICLE